MAVDHGARHDRGFYEEYVDKTVRTSGAAWWEPNGAAVFFDDFLGDTLASDNWLATNTDGTDTTGSAFAITAAAGDPVAAHGGWISATPGTNSDSAEELGFGADNTPASGFKAARAGNGLLVFETRITCPVITNTRIIAGLSDDPTEGAGVAMSISSDTITTNNANGSVFVFDTGATTDVFYGISVGGDSDSATGAVYSTVGIAPTASTAMVLRIEMDSAGTSHYYQNGTYYGTLAALDSTASDALAAALLTPYLAVGSLGTDGAALEADYVFVACAR